MIVYALSPPHPPPPPGAFYIGYTCSVLCLLLTAFQDLQGDVEYYTLFWSSATSNESRKILKF